jgi:N-acetylglucosamine-6-phosphate deacetylase
LLAHVDDKCGSIILGRDADFVVFSPDLTLVETYVGGNSFGNAFAE